MKQIDYSDINKFLVSIGILLIGIAILIPYLYLKEDFGIYFEQNALEKLQEPIQNIIKDKQNKIIAIQKILPWLSLTFLISGILSCIVGLYRWFNRQSKIDEKFDKELMKLDLEIDSLTLEETEEKVKNEVNEIELAEQNEKIDNSSSIQKQNFHDYFTAEKKVINAFTRYRSLNFEILSNQRLGNKFEIDLLLRAKSRKYSDRIVEIKYFKNQFPKLLTHKIVEQINASISYYKKVANKQVIPVLIIVYNDNKMTEVSTQKYYDTVMSYSKNKTNLKRLKVEFIPFNSIDQFNVQKILKR